MNLYLLEEFSTKCEVTNMQPFMEHNDVFLSNTLCGFIIEWSQHLWVTKSRIWNIYIVQTMGDIDNRY
jgi:hypothetical protein